MSLRTSLRPWTITFFSALGITSVPACGDDTNAFPCEEGKPLVGAGDGDTGYITCKGGWEHRPRAKECASTLPRPTMCEQTIAGATTDCTTDSDCRDGPNGYCFGEQSAQGIGCFCRYGCLRDSDCADGQVCLCGDPVGTCISATCTMDADCEHGFLCATYTSDPGCGGPAFACQTPDDECAADADCPEGEQCTLTKGRRTCSGPVCVIGRPFLVAGEERLAPLARRADWSTSFDVFDVACADAEGREALAARWARIGLMEHASVAAFARFALQLLALGAPADLLAATHRAMSDETQHARLAFGLASAFARRHIGPGPLAIDGALGGESLLEIVATTVREGCIGETVAAVEAAEALAHCTVTAVRAVLERVVHDETSHAELAWRFVRWALDVASPTEQSAIVDLLRSALADEIAAARAFDAPASRLDGDLLAGGILPDAHRVELRQRVLIDVVSPCIDALEEMQQEVVFACA